MVVIYSEQGKVLVLQRDDDANFWQSVTGTLEPGELPIETAIREVKEETGIDVNALGLTVVDCRQVNQFKIRPRWQHRYPPSTQYNTEYVYALMCSGNEKIHLSEHLQYRWLSKQEAIEKVWSETNRAAISRFVPELSGKG